MRQDYINVKGEARSSETVTRHLKELLTSADELTVGGTRVWSRDGKLIFHQPSESVPSLLEGKPVDWATLSPCAEMLDA